MTNYIYIIALLLYTPYMLGQEIVMAANGLNIRQEPNIASNKIGKLYCGAKVKIIKKTTKTLSIKDKDSAIKGAWVKIEFENYPMFVSEYNTGYVFSGYLKNELAFVSALQQEISKLNKFKTYSVANQLHPFIIIGDFFGDGTPDYAIKVLDNLKKTRILIIDKGGNNTQLLGSKNFDAEADQEYQWTIIDEFSGLPIFEKVNAQEILWSNYTTDFRNLEEVPKAERVVLPYDALYVHAAESCGGGFIFWKNGVFNWLQQE